MFEALVPVSDRLSDRVGLIVTDSAAWMAGAPAGCVHAIVTDPPYGLDEFAPEQLAKKDAGSGGLWRVPPTLDGSQRQPVPRFSVLSDDERARLAERFEGFGRLALHVLKPGGHLFLASNPLVSSRVFTALEAAGLEKRGEIIRLVQTLRGGDRPKGAHERFADVTVMPRSAWEPWGLFRKPFTGTVAHCLETHGTGALRRTSEESPFRDVIRSAPTSSRERSLVRHPSLKPQAFMREIVRASLPLGEGLVLDPFSGGGSTLAAAEALGYGAIGLERSEEYAQRARAGFPALVRYAPASSAT
ncbi:MAG: site-specific DNA-methyltransferase [Myxococcota bacterium]